MLSPSVVILSEAKDLGILESRKYRDPSSPPAPQDDALGFSHQVVICRLRFLLPKILAAALAVFWAVRAAQGAEAKLNRVSDTVIEITGGTGREAWRLRYGTVAPSSYRPIRPLLARGENDRAWFAHGAWLRLIDTKQGLVIGRWHFPGRIVTVLPVGHRVRVGFKSIYSDRVTFEGALELGPDGPRPPSWPDNELPLYGTSYTEARMAWPEISLTGWPYKVSAEQARKLLPEVEEAVRRDPLTPWFRMALGKLMLDVDDPRAKATFEEAVRLPTTDFTELFRISAFLDDVGEHETARAAFERAYQDYWQQGNDPRLLQVLIWRLFIYPAPFGPPGMKLSAEQRREIIDRVYRLTPYGEGAGLAWQLYADDLAKSGPPEEARLWRARAREADRESIWHAKPAVGRKVDQALLIVLASIVASVFYTVALYARYRRQRWLDAATRERNATVTRGYACFSAEYWSRRERVGFFTIVLAAWVGLGVADQGTMGILRRAASPITLVSGSFAGPVNEWFLENRLPQSPERDLLLAYSFQESGEKDKAERLYRRLPQFAESWNNLGVILKNAGKDQEARQAFERALQIDHGLGEAALNLGRPPQDFWTEQYHMYVPGRPMLAPPRGRHLIDAFLGGSDAQFYARAMLGPFALSDVGRTAELGYHLFR